MTRPISSTPFILTASLRFDHDDDDGGATLNLSSKYQPWPPDKWIETKSVAIKRMSRKRFQHSSAINLAEWWCHHKVSKHL